MITIELEEIKNTIVKLLHEYTNRPVVMLSQAHERPHKDNKTDYPFIGFSINTIKKDREMGSVYEELKKSDNIRFEYDVVKKRVFQSQCVFSFSAYASTRAQAQNLAQRAWDFFKHAGYLSLENITVIECTDIQSRDAFEVDGYERRAGFDVRIRFVHNIDLIVETIEENKINRKD